MTLTKIWYRFAFTVFKMIEIWSVDSQEVIKTVATRCQILRLKCTKFDFGWGSTPDPLGVLTAVPRSPSWIL